MTSTAHIRPPVKPASGVASWVNGTPTAAQMDLGTAMLRIVSQTQRGPVSEIYWVQRIVRDGATVAYTLTRLPSSAGVVYTVDTTFGPEAEHWSCTCPDATWRRGQGRCKHCLGLHVALAAV